MTAGELLREMFAYTSWGRGRLLDAAGRLTDAQLGETTWLDHGTTLRTLRHAIRAEANWRRRIEGAEMVPEVDFDGVDGLKAAWEAEAAQWHTLLDDLNDDDLERLVTYRFANGSEHTDQLWRLVLHVFSHDVQHISEAALAISRQGSSPGDLDYLEYVHPA